jgi:dihydrolipoamide dehydrogenase
VTCQISIDLDGVRGFKDGVVSKLTGGLAGLARKRTVKVVTGTARFIGPKLVEVTGPSGPQTISFDQCVIACGSEPVHPSFLPEDPRIIDSTGALALADVPKRMLVIGGGIIGLEMAQVYHALGAQITIVELMEQIIPGADKDIVAPLMKRIETRYAAVHLGTKVTGVSPGPDALTVTFEGPDGAFDGQFDKVLVAVGRAPNSGTLGLEVAGVTVDARGFIPVDAQMRTKAAGIYAIGDIVGQPMLAHKAVHEGKVAAEVAAGHKAAFDPLAIPSVAYTDPEIAWAGVTENAAKAQGIKVKKAVFPWAASGRSLSLGRSDGLTKLLVDPDTGKLLGAGIAGPGAGELLAEAMLAIEMGADAEDIGLTIHPHPTLSETVAMAAEVFSGTITDL